MVVRIVETPALLISVEEMKQDLNVEHADDDDLIESFILAAQAQVEGHIDGAISDKTIECQISEFASPIRLPNVPMVDPDVAIESVEYVDENGDSQSMDAEDYVLVGSDLWPVDGVEWPTVAEPAGPVTITYTVGVGTAQPQAVAAVRLLVRDLYDGEDKAMPTVSRLLESLKSWSV